MEHAEDLMKKIKPYNSVHSVSKQVVKRTSAWRRRIMIMLIT